VLAVLLPTIGVQAVPAISAPANSPAAQITAAKVAVLTIDGAIAPASADYFVRGLERSVASGATLVVLELDTPGGLDDSMRKIVKAILGSPVPVVTWVSPSGARAASAGTFILYASHIAAMAPGTNLGAATPVPLGGPPMPGGGDRMPTAPADAPAIGDDAAKPASSNASNAKAMNDALAYIRSLAELRGRNQAFAEQAVRNAATMSAEEALEAGVIDLTATSLGVLLRELDGREVTVADRPVRIVTTDAEILRKAPDWRANLLAVITNPNVALILMLIGVYGLFFELMNPGALIPGTIGAISLLLGLYALSVLPVNLAGAGLLVLGLGLLIAEAFTPSVGILGFGGAVAFAAGALFLFDAEAIGFGVSWQVAVGLGLVGFAFSTLIGRLAVKAWRSQVTTGEEGLVGASAEVLVWNGTSGFVFCHGERWQATGPVGLLAGQKVTVRHAHGVSLEVLE